ncbi:reverse transcriptase domain-containing protein, partial [Tanacetum coccineum]
DVERVKFLILFAVRDIIMIEHGRFLNCMERIRELELNQFDRYEGSTTDSVVQEHTHDGFHNNFARRHPNREPATDPLRTLGIRTDLPEFDGSMHPDDFIDWIQTVERIFDIRDIPDNLKVKLVAIKLKKYASLWWEHVQKQRERKGKYKVESWDKMKRLLRAKFLPINHRQNSFLDYHNLRQQSLSVDDFLHEFERVRMRCGIDEDEEQVIARLLGALRPEISDVIQLQQYWSFNDVCRLAYQVEKQLLARSKPSTRPNPSVKPTTTPSTVQRGGPIKADPNPFTPSVQPGSSSGTLRCFKCQGLGHLKRDCPNKQVLAFVDETEPIYDTEPEEEDLCSANRTHKENK